MRLRGPVCENSFFFDRYVKKKLNIETLNTDNRSVILNTDVDKISFITFSYV